MHKNIIKFLIIIFSGILVFAEGLYLLAVPAIVNSAIESGKIGSIIEKKYSLTMNFDELEVKTHPDFSISVNTKNLSLLSKSKKQIFYTKNAKTRVFLPSLILKKIKLKSLNTENLQILLCAKPDKKIYFGEIPLQSFVEKLKGINADFEGIRTNNSKITLIETSSSRITEVDVQNADFVYKKNKEISLLLKSKIAVNAKDKTDIQLNFHSGLPLEKGLTSDKLSIEGTLKNLDFSDYIDYFRAFDFDIEKVNGILNAEFTNGKNIQIAASLRDFCVKKKNPIESFSSNSEINLKSEIAFLSKTLVLKSFDVKSSDWRILLDGEVKNYYAKDVKNVKLNLNTEILPSDIHSLLQLLPSLPKEQDSSATVQKLKKYGVWGIANGKLQIKGEANTPQIHGNMRLNDVYILKNNPLVKHCQILCDFFGDKMKLKTRVYTGGAEYVDIEGESGLSLYSVGDFKIVSSKNVDLAIASAMLVPIHEIVGFDLGPVPYMQLKGKGNIDIHTKGTVFDGIVDGKFNFRDVETTLDGLNVNLSKTNGSLVFDKKNMHFFTTSSYIGKKTLKIDGKANLDGDIDFDVTSNSLDLGELLHILNTSPIVGDRKSFAEFVEKINGTVSTKIKITGKVKDFSTIKDNETVEISGILDLKNAAGKLKSVPFVLHNIKGSIAFDNDGWKTDLVGFLRNSKISIDGFLKKNKADVNISGNSVNVDDIFAILESSDFDDIKKLTKLGKTYSFVNFDANYKSNKGISFERIMLNNIKAKGKLVPQSTLSKDVFVGKMSGDFSLAGGVLTVKNFNSNLYKSKFFADAKISNIFSQTPLVNGNVKLSNFDMSQLNSLKHLDCLPFALNKLLNAYENYQGVVDSSIKIKNNNLDGFVNLKDVKFNHAYFKTPISVDSGKITLNNSKLTMKSLIANIDEAPVFLNLSVWDFDKTMKMDGYFTTKLTDKIVNKYINNMLTYPLKPKGDITVTTDLSGSLDSVNVHTKLKIAPNADLYYMGANLGDENEEREIITDLNVKNNTYWLKKLDYVRYMTSQNDKSYPLTILTANGIFEKYSKNNRKTFYIKDFNVRTLNNANVKIFNVLFKKSVLKNGMFNCKLNIKGDVNAPIVRGDVVMNNIDVPLYETIVKNVSLKFKDKIVDISADGSVLNSDFSFSAALLNKFYAPYTFEFIDVKSKQLNLDSFIDTLTAIPTPDVSSKMVGTSSKNNLPLNVSDIRIKKGTMFVQDIIIRDLPASNYNSEFSFGNDMVLNIDNLSFDVTTGKMKGSASYNFKNGKIKAAIRAINVDSNKIASALFGFKDQIFGQANGNIDISTNGANEEERIKNLLGQVYFEVFEGKMPKLGSVEYLLKAGNFIKSGITGASINNLLALLAPVKTGYFESIKGSFSLKNGVAQNIEVFSKGENLNLFINGDYDILLQYADLRVFGRLTRNAANILGQVGNLSLNSLLNSIPGIKFDKNNKNSILKEINKIPGVEFSDKDYRVFTVKVDGQMNDDKFVKNFRWVE